MVTLRIVLRVVLLAALGAQAAAGELGGPSIVGPSPIERPEMRSHQPYSGLQFGFRPEPPRARGIRRENDTRPKIVMPIPLSPLIEYGPPSPHTSQYYRYCGAKSRCR